MRGCTDGGERLERLWEWRVCARVPAWPRLGAAGAGKGIMCRCTALLVGVVCSAGKRAARGQW